MFNHTFLPAVIDESIKEYEKDPDKCITELHKLVSMIDKNEWMGDAYYLNFAWLAQSGYVELMKIFIEFIDLNFVVDGRTWGDRLLAYAVSENKEDMINYLLSLGVIPVFSLVSAYRVDNKKIWLLLYSNDPERLYALNSFLKNSNNISFLNYQADVFGAAAYLSQSTEDTKIILKLIKMYE